MLVFISNKKPTVRPSVRTSVIHQSIHLSLKTSKYLFNFFLLSVFYLFNDVWFVSYKYFVNFKCFFSFTGFQQFSLFFFGFGVTKFMLKLYFLKFNIQFSMITQIINIIAITKMKKKK